MTAMNLRSVMLAAAVAAALPVAVSAARISLEINAAATVTNGMLTARISGANHGNAAAADGRFELSLDHAAAATALVGQIPPGATTSVVLRVQLPQPHDPGAHVAILRTRYNDPAGHPFTSVSILPYTSGTAPTGTLAAVGMAPARLHRRGSLRVTAASLTGAPLPCTLRLILPDELQAEMETSTWIVPPGGTTRSIPLRNAGATPDSCYPVSVVLHTTHDGIRHSYIAHAEVQVAGPSLNLPMPMAGGVILILGLLAAAVAWKRRTSAPSLRHRRLWDAAALTIATACIGYHVAPPAVLSDTLCIGGDTIAHHYIVTHLRDQLLHHGRVVSWAPGWWCGFPLFRYYFPLPYVAIVLLDLLLPYNIAFKLGAILGILLLPLAAYLGARRLKLPWPLPGLLALVTLPMALDTTHTMWGVNAYSTLAGMIANSYSFSLMLIAVPSALRDALDGRARASTVLLLWSVVMSHFFTALMTAGLLLFVPLLPGVKWRPALRVLAIEGLFTLGLSVWWVVPLVLGRPYSVDFGLNWTVELTRHIPAFLRFAGLPVIVAGLLCLRRRHRRGDALRAFTALTLVLALIAGLLFSFGYNLSPIFVNVRLWPFMVWAALTLCAIAAALMAHTITPLAVWPILGLLLLFPWDRPNNARTWAEYNFEGLEALPAGYVVPALLEPLRGTPGRLANDLHPDNERLGSSRIIEATPYLIGKPILEGGILNSALGALPAYTIQGELSDNVAGFPTRVQPRAFKPQAGMRHLEYMNVAHFVARSPRTQAAFEAAANWTLSHEADGWQVFACTSHDGELVRLLPCPPRGVVTPHWKDALLEWMYAPAAVSTPIVLLDPDEPPPPSLTGIMKPDAYRQWLDSLADTPVPPPEAVRRRDQQISRMAHSPQRISFRTTAIGEPHLIAATWYPNWQVSGAARIYRATPVFMLVYPTQPDVVLRFRRLPREVAASAVTGIAWIALLGWVVGRMRTRRSPSGKEKT